MRLGPQQDVGAVQESRVQGFAEGLLQHPKVSLGPPSSIRPHVVARLCATYCARVRELGVSPARLRVNASATRHVERRGVLWSESPRYSTAGRAVRKPACGGATPNGKCWRGPTAPTIKRDRVGSRCHWKIVRSKEACPSASQSSGRARTEKPTRMPSSFRPTSGWVRIHDR